MVAFTNVMRPKLNSVRLTQVLHDNNTSSVIFSALFGVLNSGSFYPIGWVKRSLEIYR